MRSLKRPTVSPWAVAAALLTGCSLGSAAGSGPSGELEPPREGENPSAFTTIPVSVRNHTGFDALVVSVEFRRHPRRERLGTVGAMKEEVFQARLGFYRDLRFEIALRGGGTCSSEGASGISVLQSIDLIILPGSAQRPGEPGSCVCQMTVL
jgi:hypothetical protein